MKRIKKLMSLMLSAVSCFLVVSSRMTPVRLDKVQKESVQAEIKGEVQSPGVYTLPNGSCLADLIETAGGTSDRADLAAFSLQKKIEDGGLFVIPAQREEEAALMISITTATAEQLQSLSGIGPAIAERIVEYREENGFTCLEDLMNVKGIGEKTFAKIREFLIL